jgi:tetratricopeptide (TPR) repeat protein
MLSQAAAGDLDQLRRARSDLLDPFGPTTVPLVADHAAWYGSLVPGVDTHLEALVRLAELAVNGESNAIRKRIYLKTLGAVLYRVGRFDDAARRLEEGIQLQDGMSVTDAWAFMAMAHHRLGHRDQARRYLERLRSRRPSADPNKFWDELEIRLLGSEAEALVLYDPAFPANPFAP